MDENIAQKVLKKDIENIFKKVAEGKTLTEAERLRIESAYEKSTDPVYAKNIVELAEILGVARQTVSRWRRQKRAPKPLSNGYHDVAQWRDFVREHGFKETDNPEIELLKVRKLLAEVRQSEMKLEIMEGQYLSIDKIREVWTGHIGQVRSVLESRFLNELPPLLTTLDAIQIREKLQEVLDECYKILSNTNVELSETAKIDEN